MKNELSYLVQILPAGEWINIEIIESEGMMAKYGTIFARATNVRNGKPAFLKCIPVAGSHAGESTREVVSSTRLKRIYDRIKKIQQFNEKIILVKKIPIPLVKIFDIQYLEEHSILFIAMEQIKVLKDVINSGEAGITLALNLISNLGSPPDNDEFEWHHFDICPSNIGITTEKQCCFIDPESLYLASENLYNISCPACKDFRMPSKLLERLLSALQNPKRIHKKLLKEKQNFEVLLSAAECSLETPIFSHHYRGFSHSVENWIELWFQECEKKNQKLTYFWKAILEKYLKLDQEIDLNQIFKDLQTFETTQILEKDMPLNKKESISPEYLSKNETSILPKAVLEKYEEESPSYKLVNYAQLLRSERLKINEILFYKNLLFDELKKNPKKELCIELIFVMASYLDDLNSAYIIAKEYIDVWPEDQYILQLYRMLKVCSDGSK